MKTNKMLRTAVVLLAGLGATVSIAARPDAEARAPGEAVALDEVVLVSKTLVNESATTPSYAIFVDQGNCFPIKTSDEYTGN
jgi:hypothetical protein